jgi:hypothetical protein
LLTERHSDVHVAETIEVRVSRCLDDFSGVSICEWNNVPFLSCCSGGIEEPVALVGHKRFDLVDVIAVTGGADANDITKTVNHIDLKD